MASPQVENGYTMIANELMEEFAKLPLTGHEFSILLVILRKTYGFHKKTDSISISQFQKEGKMSRQSAVNCLTRLVKANILVKSTSDYVCAYGIQKDHDLWVVKPNRLVKNNSKLVKANRPKLVKANRHTKEKKDNTKETSIRIDGGRPQKDLQEIIDFSKSKNFSLQGSEKQNRRYAYNLLRKKDGNGNVLGKDRVKWLVEVAISVRGQSYAPQINDFKSLFYKWQDLINFKQKEKNDKRNVLKVEGKRVSNSF